MKKLLLIASAVVFATAANAQETIVAFATEEDQTNLGISGADMTAEQIATPFVTSDAGDLYLAFPDKWKSSAAYDKYNTVKFNGGEEIVISKYGAVGNANPTFVSYQDGAQSAGAVFKIESKLDGYITVFTKLNDNKQFVVMEGKTGCLAYRMGFANASTQFQFSQPSDEDGMIDFSVNPDNKYFAAAQKQSTNEAGQLLWLNKDNEVVAGDRPTWEVEDGTNDDGTPKYKTVNGAAVMEDIVPRQDKPQFPWITAGLEKSTGNGTAFVTFNVLGIDPATGKGNTYYISALGSKIPLSGFVFTENDPTITYCATGDLPEITFVPGQDPIIGESAVESIEAAAADAPIYNMMGVRVNADAKGILIQNGKKFIRK
ncbi:MAG: hypothetical protein K2H60_15960 [Muribaculaceae bacterium]|nr:hypothetical protein [Muribaculaceae bacterium]